MKEFDKPLQTSPFIKLLRSPHSGYFYDVNRNEIIPIDDDVYTYLDKLLKDGTEDGAEETLEKVAELKENGYLSNNRVKEIKHPMTDYLEDIMARGVQHLTLQLTQDCNFRCSYCPYTNNIGTQRTHSKNKMSIDTAKQAILFLNNHSIDCDNVSIGFYGGEPLLEFELIKQIVDICEKILFGKNVTYNITTNGSLLTREICDFLESKKFSVTISLDGEKEINDKNRVFAENGKGTYKTVMKKILMICNEYNLLKKRLRINMVLDPRNNIDEMIKIYDALAIEYDINIGSSLIDDTFDNHIEYNADFVMKYEYCTFLNYVNRISNESHVLFGNERYNSLKVQYNKQNYRNMLPNITSHSGPCIAGVSRPLIGFDGCIYPCERVSETSDCMNIGSIFKDYDLVNIKQLINIGMLSENECKNCWAISLCTICAKFVDDKGKLSTNKKKLVCDSSRQYGFELLKSFILIKDIERINGDAIYK